MIYGKIVHIGKIFFTTLSKYTGKGRNISQGHMA